MNLLIPRAVRSAVGACGGVAIAITLAACASMAEVDQTKNAEASKQPSELTISLATLDKSATFKADGQSLTSGQTVSGTLSDSDEQLGDGSAYDPYRIHLERGQTIRIAIASSAFDTYLVLVGPDGGWVAQDDDGGSGLNSAIEYQVGSSGEYTILANALGAGGRGSYRLSVEVAGGGGGSMVGTDGTSALSDGVALRGELDGNEPRLDDGSPYDLRTYEGRTGERVVISVNSSAFDPMVTIGLMENGEIRPLASDDDSGDGLNPRLVFDVPRDGTYAVIVTTYDPAGRGAYELALNRAEGASQAASEPDQGWSTNYQDGDADPSERYALLVGIDDYPGSGNDLPSCVADTRLMRDMLINRMGFSPENIVMLHDERATREHIASAFLNHLGKAGPQGTAVFYYSGHGYRLNENAALADHEPDSRDEALYVWGRTERSSTILDEELGWLAQQLETNRTLMVLDACNSGTGTRNVDWLVRSKEVLDYQVQDQLELPETWWVEESAEAESATQSKSGFFDFAYAPDEPSNHVLLAAARADQVAEARAGGWPTHGGVASTFTYFLVRELEEGSLDRSWQQVIATVNRRIQADARQQGQDPSGVQEPQAEGRGAQAAISTLLTQ